MNNTKTNLNIAKAKGLKVKIEDGRLYFWETYLPFGIPRQLGSLLSNRIFQSNGDQPQDCIEMP